MRDNLHLVSGPGTLTRAAARDAVEAAKADRPRDMSSVYSAANRERYLGYVGDDPKKSRDRRVRRKPKKNATAKSRPRKRR